MNIPASVPFARRHQFAYYSHLSQTTFFIPAARTTKQQADVYEAIRQFAVENTGWEISDRKIFAIRYRHEGVEAIAQVGERDIDGEVVLAILDSVTYLVCTPNRGGIRGMPILVGKHEVSDVTCFDEKRGKKTGQN